MEIINAHWEDRNLGVSTQELNISTDDDLESIKVIISQMSAEYQVVRVEGFRFEVNEYLASLGYMYFETLLGFAHSLKAEDVPERARRVAKLSLLGSSFSLEDLNRQIRFGMFESDRISLDPRFGESIASERYVNYVADEIEAGAEFLVWGFRGEPVAFFTIRERPEGFAYVGISGVFKGVSIPGAGVSLQNAILETCQRRGLAHANAYVSTNNVAALRLHIGMGFELQTSKSIFVKHATTIQ